METATNRFKLSIFAQLIAAFLLVITPLYGVGLLMNLVGESIVEKELSNSLESRVDFYQDTLEKEIQNMMGLLQEYVIDEDLHHLTFLSGIMTLSEWSETVRSIQSKLRVIKSSSEYARGVSAHILTLERTLSSEKSISDALDPEYESAGPYLARYGTGVYYHGDRLFLGIASPGPAAFRESPGFALTIEVNLETLGDTLATFADYANAGAALINPHRGTVLADDPSAAIIPELRNYIRSAHSTGQTDGLRQLSAGGEDYLVAYAYAPSLEMYLTAYMPSEQMMKPIDTYKRLLWLMSLVSLLIVVLYSNWIFRRIHTPLRTMVKAFRKVEHGQLEPIRLPRRSDEFIYLFERFNLMMERLKVLIGEVYEQKIRTHSSELKQLQAQINPHFLYNTYFILYRLAKSNDNENVMLFSQYLGEYFRYITRSGTDEASLEQEAQHARTYTEIQQFRFMNRIAVEFDDVPEAYRNAQVPRLILQPLIENAYKYGMELKRKGGLVRVSFREEEGRLAVAVEDNGERLTDETLRKLAADLASSSSGELEYTGLLNVHRRLQIRFGERYGLTVSRGEEGGLRVTMTIPGRDGDAPIADRR